MSVSRSWWRCNGNLGLGRRILRKLSPPPQEQECRQLRAIPFISYSGTVGLFFLAKLLTVKAVPLPPSGPASHQLYSEELLLFDLHGLKSNVRLSALVSCVFRFLY